jgi:putative nucleotidyltransferase with HDIG domain
MAVVTNAGGPGILATDAWSLEEIVSSLRFDPVLTGRVLRIANSPAFSPKVPVTDVRRAAMQLGAMQIVSIAVGVAARGRMQGSMSAFGASDGALWKHSIAAAIGAERGNSHAGLAVASSDAFVAGLLHDIGKVALARHLTREGWDLVVAHSASRGVGIDIAETAVLTVNHAQLGAIIAERWELPKSIQKAIQFHHSPGQATDHGAHARAAWLGNVIARVIGTGVGVEEQPDYSLDLANLGLSHEVFDAACEETQARLSTVLSWYE